MHHWMQSKSIYKLLSWTEELL